MADHNDYAQRAREQLSTTRGLLPEDVRDRVAWRLGRVGTAIDALEATCALMLEGLQTRDRTIRELRLELETEQARYALLKRRHRIATHEPPE